MQADLFDYELPPDLIARHPAAERDQSRLMCLDRAAGAPSHHRFAELPGLLPAGALLVLNETRVVPARLFGQRPSGGRVETLLVAPLGTDDRGRSLFSALAHANRPLRPGQRLDLGGLDAEVVAKGERGAITLALATTVDGVYRHLEARGEVPLPPYLEREPEPADRERYQTVYARHDGSVAAPTAGLHFTPRLLDALAAAGCEVARVTLHVGPGTFRPIVARELTDHRMDAERYVIPAETVAAVARARAAGRAIIAVGTTTVRALEGAAARTGALGEGPGETELFITPGFDFRVVDGLITNFHLPRSTLLCLVSALAGRERLLDAYREAVAGGYRFYSYGDAMLVRP